MSRPSSVNPPYATSDGIAPSSRLAAAAPSAAEERDFAAAGALGNPPGSVTAAALAATEVHAKSRRLTFLAMGLSCSSHANRTTGHEWVAPDSRTRVSAVQPRTISDFSRLLSHERTGRDARKGPTKEGSRRSIIRRVIATAAGIRSLRTVVLAAAIAAISNPAPVIAAGQRLPGDPAIAIDGPPPPLAPEVIARDAAGRATIRAVRLTAPLRIDGRLDEEIYTTVPPASGLIQVEPQEGAPASEKTDIWVTFDASRFHVSVRCWESHPERLIANEMRRDNNNIFQNDYVAIVLDTFYDRRNASYFAVTPIGGRADGQIANERQYITDWNTVWDVEVNRFEGGWTVEFAIPFKSLRYRPGQEQVWGLNVERRSRWRNEESFLTRIPASFGFNRAFMQVSYAASLVGLQVPPGSRNLEVKPYGTSRVTTDRLARPPIANDATADAGLDVKYGLTQNLTTDFTLNTDFAQVEADEQRVNLTRFSLFFPEKREFFLENQGMFGFGGAVTGGGQASTSDTPILFYSRRIGLADLRQNQDHTVPIRGGGRLTGRVGRFSVGALNLQTGDDPVTASRATNFPVVRLKRDVFRR